MLIELVLGIALINTNDLVMMYAQEQFVAEARPDSTDDDVLGERQANLLRELGHNKYAHRWAANDFLERTAYLNARVLIRGSLSRDAEVRNRCVRILNRIAYCRPCLGTQICVSCQKNPTLSWCDVCKYRRSCMACYNSTQDWPWNQ